MLARQRSQRVLKLHARSSRPKRRADCRHGHTLLHVYDDESRYFFVHGLLSIRLSSVSEEIRHTSARMPQPTKPTPRRTTLTLPVSFSRRRERSWARPEDGKFPFFPRCRCCVPLNFATQSRLPSQIFPRLELALPSHLHRLSCVGPRAHLTKIIFSDRPRPPVSRKTQKQRCTERVLLL